MNNPQVRMFVGIGYRNGSIIQFHSNHSNQLYIQANTNGTSSNVINIEDCLNYDSCTSNSGKWVIPSAVALSEYNSNGWKYGNASSFQFIDLNNQSYIADYSVEFKITEFNNGLSVYFENTSSSRVYLADKSSNYSLNGNTTSTTIIANDIVRLEYESNTLKLYVNNNLISNINHNIGNAKFRIGTGTSRYIRIKDFKIKTL